jgi:hypothetical protein
MQRIFYSWQSTSPPATNGELIRSCLTAAARRLAQSPEVDEAIRSAPGSPSIFSDILERINRCSVFVADLTLARLATEVERYSPNPNVLIEYGYALSGVGEKRIVSIVNTHFGPVEQLPFDLRHKAVKISYDLSPSAKPSHLARTERELTESLERELRLVLEDPVAELNLSASSVRVARYFIEGSEHGTADSDVAQRDLAEALELDEQEIHRAVAELASRGYLERLAILGTTTPPVSPAPRLFWDFDRFIKGWDPRRDARTVALALIASSETGHGRLATRTFADHQGWPLRRLNPALGYLIEWALVDESSAMVPDLVTSYIYENERTRPFMERRLDPDK